MDIKQKAATETAFLHLRDGDEELMYDGAPSEGRKVGVWVYGPGTRQYTAAQARQENRTYEVLKKKGKVDQSADEKIAANADFLASITQRFENLDYDGLTGNSLAMAVYSDQTLGFIGQQVRQFGGEWANFTKDSAKS